MTLDEHLCGRVRLDVPMGELAGLWFKLTIAAIPVAIAYLLVALGIRAMIASL
jgi:hypothetical protein